MNDLVVSADPDLERELERLGRARAVFFAGLPGTGKSLLVHQLAHLAAARKRIVHLFQWDVVRPVFEATRAAVRYPIVDGVTHVLIRKAAGVWARRALVTWDTRHPEPEHLLIGETPFVGNRFTELIRREPDAAEALLGSPVCRFVIAVPSATVRAFLEAERARRAERPRHEREREDAPPVVLRDLWRDLVRVAGALGLSPAAGSPAETIPPWDPLLYQRVYASVLRLRHSDVLRLGTVLPTSALSVYRFTIAPHDLVPDPAEAEAVIQEVERRYPDVDALEREAARWWDVRPGFTSGSPA